MASTVEVQCANAKCGAMFTARVADRARGWAKFCSKSCKAVGQEAQKHAYRERNDAGRDANEDGWDGHKNAF